MSCFRGILVGLSLAAASAHAQQARVHVRTGGWRQIEGPLVEDKAEPGPVPELHVAAGIATLLKMPVEIIGSDGFKVAGGDGRGDAHQLNSKAIVLVASPEIDSERIPLAVATTVSAAAVRA